MERSKIAPPRQRLSEKYAKDLFDNTSSGLKQWNNERVWRAAYRELDGEKNLSPKALDLIDVMNAFIRSCNYSESSRAKAYVTIAAVVRHFDDAAVKRWYDAIHAEYTRTHDTDDLDEFRENFRSSYSFHYFVHKSRCFYDSIYTDHPGSAQVLSNSIRMISAVDRTGEPLVYETRQRELLLPHYRLDEEMDNRDILEAIGIMRLHDAWRTTDDGEKQKIKRFVAAHADEMDIAISIVRSRYVDSLDHLETLMEASETPALMEGAL